MLELGTISNSLSSEKVSEDGDDDIIGVVSWALDDSVSKKKDNSNILEAVGSKEEGNSVPFDNISEDGLRLLGIALVKHGLSLLQKGQNFNLEREVLVLNRKIGTVLSSASLASISGLRRSKTLATQSSCLAMASYFSRGLTAKVATRRQAIRMAFISIYFVI